VLPQSTRNFPSEHGRRSWIKCVKGKASTAARRARAFESSAFKRLGNKKLLETTTAELLAFCKMHIYNKVRRCPLRLEAEISAASLGPLRFPKKLVKEFPLWIHQHFRRVAGLGYRSNDVVAGSSPASGSRCRSSSVVEHVNASSFLIRRFFQRAEDHVLSDTVGWRCKSAFAFRRE
jgi:hypothetical protein